jgi:hypothetical protein
MSNNYLRTGCLPPQITKVAVDNQGLVNGVDLPRYGNYNLFSHEGNYPQSPYKSHSTHVDNLICQKTF